MNDTLSAALSKIMNAEKAGKSEVEIKPGSKLLTAVLQILKDKRYIGDFNMITDSHGSRVVVSLIGEINKMGPIKPRYAITLDEIEKFERRYLAAKDFGFLIISTSQGVMTHNEAKKENIGGRLLAYCY
jgi:small subunit ribosomal protein S8